MNNFSAAVFSESTSKASNIFMRGLLAGFVLVAFMAMALSAFGVYSSRQIQEELYLVVNEHSRHIELLRSMEQLSQKRTRLNYEILQSNDAFEQDAKIQEFSDAAGQFLAAREALFNLSLGIKERDLLAQQSAVATNVQSLLGRTIKLVMAGERKNANHLLLTRAIPEQVKLLAITSELIAYNQAEVESIQRSALIKSQQQQRLLIFGGMLAIFLTLAIGLRVWRILSALIGGLQDTQQTLASTIRTMEFQQIAMDEHAIVSITDPAGKIISVNEKFSTVSQYQPEEITGKDHRILNSNFHPHAFFAEMWETIASGKIWQGNIRNRRKDGSFYWVASTIVPFLNEQGKPYQYVSMRTDITQLIEAEQLLRTQRDFSNAAINAQPGIFFMLSDDLKFIQSNDFFSGISGYSTAEISQLSPTDMVADADKEQVKDHIRTCIEQGSVQFESGLLTKSGRKIPFMVQFVSVMLNNSRYIIGTGVDISDLKKTEHALRDAKDEAEHANAAKSEFLSSMSHELRTPMNAILGFSQLMTMDNTLSGPNRDYVREILKAGDHLLLLINDVLDLTKVESGSIDLTLGPVAVSDLIDECLGLVGTLADKRAIRLDHFCIRGAIVKADGMRLKQALLNLLSNAIKYNREGGSVNLTLELADPDQLRILVSDSGHGIPAGKMAELFQPFNRLGAENGVIEGTGIGLTITRKIVELMGGSVGVTSEVGVGSTFWIELPLETMIENENTHSTAIGNSAISFGKTDEKQHLVLYIEDNPSNIKLMAQILRYRKHIHLLTAHTPELGIELALTRHPDLILLDINMEGMDGYQVLKVLKAEESLQQIPLIAVTANAMPRDILQGKQAGFNDYLTKPIEIMRLNKLLDDYLCGEVPKQKSAI